jgi:putative FmdB family regulatory protein
MPIYEYRCQACQSKFERYFGAMSVVDDEISCPECGSSDVRRMISATAVHLGDGGGSGLRGEEEAPAEKPVFGRKELNESLAQRQEWAVD